MAEATETETKPKRKRKSRVKGGFALVEIISDDTQMKVVKAQMSSSLEAEHALRELVHDAIASGKPAPTGEYGIVQMKRVGMRPKAEVKTTVTF